MEEKTVTRATEQEEFGTTLRMGAVILLAAVGAGFLNMELLAPLSSSQKLAFFAVGLLFGGWLATEAFDRIKRRERRNVIAEIQSKTR